MRIAGVSSFQACSHQTCCVCTFPASSFIVISNSGLLCTGTSSEVRKLISPCFPPLLTAPSEKTCHVWPSDIDTRHDKPASTSQSHILKSLRHLLRASASYAAPNIPLIIQPRPSNRNPEIPSVRPKTPSANRNIPNRVQKLLNYHVRAPPASPAEPASPPP